MSEQSKDELYEKISAFLDGESDAPQDVQRLLRTNDDAVRLHAELSNLSKQMKAMPSPDVHPAFATRVIAHVREARDAELATSKWRQIAVRLVGAATAVVFIGIVVWPFMHGEKSITDPVSPAVQRDPLLSEVMRLRNQPEQTLTAQFGPLIAETDVADSSDGADSDLDLGLAAGPANGEYDEVVGKVATLLREDHAYDDEGDVFAAIDSLSQSQAEALRALLTNSDEGGNELL